MLIREFPQTHPRPFLKWAGGKSQLISQYAPYLPQNFTNYYEPFLGGGSVFFYLYCYRPNIYAFLTDINSELINAYCCVRDNVEQLITLLKEEELRHSKEHYYKRRALVPVNPFERAARLIYLNKTCFNGLYRENSKGEFNVPIGRYKKPKICHPELLRTVSTALQSTRIEVSRFESVLDYAKSPEDFVYFDPPYHPISSTSNFTAYNRYSFNEEEQIRLNKIFVELARRGVKVFLSNSDCPLVRELYREFKIIEILAARAINSVAKKRGKIAEVLITSS